MDENSGEYFLSKDPCPCCEAGPLVFVSCAGCGAVIGWCGERDYGVGWITGGGLAPFGRGEHPDWARKQCALCGADTEKLGYADAGALKKAGIAPGAVMRRGPGGSIDEVGPEW